MIDRDTLNRRMWYHWLDHEAMVFLHKKEIELLRHCTPPMNCCDYYAYAMAMLIGNV